MHVIGGLLFLTLARVSLSFSTSFWNIGYDCSASLAPNQYGAALADCPFPSFSGLPLPPSTQVTSPATIRDVKLTWSLNQNKHPQLHVALDAESPLSAQEYKIMVSTGGSIFQKYCGKVSTLKPAGGQTQRQMITVNVDCLRGYLKPNEIVFLIVEAKGAPASARVFRRMLLPGCQDPAMYHSSYCVEERKKIISFTLTQQGNSVQVMISPQTRYLPGSQLHLAIEIRDATLSFIPWKRIGSTIILTHPQTSATFSNLVNGATYRVLAWRPSNHGLRYEGVITLSSGAFPSM